MILLPVGGDDDGGRGRGVFLLLSGVTHDVFNIEIKPDEPEPELEPSDDPEVQAARVAEAEAKSLTKGP